MVEDERTRTALVARIDAALGVLAKLEGELNEIKRAIEGTNPVKEALTCFDWEWMRRYTSDTAPPVHYAFNRTIDAAHIKRLLKVMDAQTLQTRIVRYLDDRDPFLVKNNHPFNLFVSRINRYVSPTGLQPWAGDVELEPDPVPDCHHEPRCADDVACMVKRAEELRKIEAEIEAREGHS